MEEFDPSSRVGVGVGVGVGVYPCKGYNSYLATHHSTTKDMVS